MRVEPFRALRYAGVSGDGLGKLIAPPYDVIPPAERQRLAAHPHNIVHLDLPVAEPGVDPYAVTGALLSSWRRGGVLARDPEPSFYITEQAYDSPDGETRLRRGLFARLSLEPYEAGVVIPHERTLETPRRDRERLLQATRAHLSAVFMLHPDPDGNISALIESQTRAAPEASTSDGDGTTIRLWRMRQPRDLQRIQSGLSEHWALIADGHHRYESALAYRDARRAAGTADAEHLLVYLCGLGDQGLSIFPIHRLVHSLGGFDPKRFRDALLPFFEIRPVGRAADLPAAVRAEAGRPGVYGMAFGSGGDPFVALWKEGAGLDRPGLLAVPAALRHLDVILLHRLVLEDLLGIDAQAQARQSHLDYVKSAALLLERADSAQVGILMNPTRIDQVIAVSRAGLRLPQKSTYFHPKVPSGLVVDPLDD